MNRYLTAHFLPAILFVFGGFFVLTSSEKAAAASSSESAAAPETTAPRDLFSDTWVATDSLGRSLPLGGEVRAPRTDKQAGIFFFTWHGPHGFGQSDPMRDDMGVVFKDLGYYESPHNLSEIFAADPENPELGKPEEFHHWGEPELGFYVADDPYVIRKHAEMLADAGIDFLFIDVTNGFTYKGVYDVIFAEYEKLQKEGRKVPKFAFITHDHADYKNVVTSLYEDIYKPGRFRSLWFEWQGKPLILAPSKGLPEEILTAFTWRQSWAWTNPAGWFGDGKDKWPWLDKPPQNFGWHESPDVPEQITVAVAQHPTTNIGRSHQTGVQPPRDQAQPGLGLYFEEQWRRAHEVDPPVTMITGWNEWVAQYFVTDGVKDVMFGQIQPEGKPMFVDAYDEEFNRDTEPMKGGSTDNLYYQMVAHMRRLKGARPIPPAGPPLPVTVDGEPKDWENITPEYRDHASDTTHRDHMGWGRIDAYTNTLGRNDIVTAKVARSDGNLYFLAQTREPITPSSDPNWMLLFIDADRNPATGWEGFDYAVNLDAPGDSTTTLKKAVTGKNGEVSWEKVADVPYAVQGNSLEIAIPSKLIGWAGEADGGLDFKWADNPEHLRDITGFFQAGDTAPSRRFKYRYAIKP
jgi:hypothetical protein